MRPTSVRGIVMLLGCSSLLTAVLWAQGGSANWLTDGGDPSRNAWQKDEETLTTSSVKDLKLLWKIQTDNQPRLMHALSAPLIVGRVATATGPRQIAVVAGVSDNLYGIDVDQGIQLWKRHFDSTYEEPAGRGGGGSPYCPGGQTATPVIGPGTTAGRYVVYAASWDGRLRQVDVATGEDVAPPELFMPPNGKPYALNLFRNVIYTTTAQGCGGSPNLVYAFDLATRKVGIYSPGSGGMWGRTGPSIGKDGTLYTGTGDGTFDPASQVYGQAIIAVKQDPITKALALTDFYGPPNAEWLLKRDMDMNVTGPVFDYKGRQFIVQSSKECRLWLLDTAALGGEDHRTAAFRSPLVCNAEVGFFGAGVWGAIASYVDVQNTRWILMPFYGPKAPDFHAPVEHGFVAHGAIAAFKVEDKTGKVQLTPAWISRDMAQAEPPVVANGVVFAYGSGESVTQHWVDPTHIGGAAGRIAESTHAVLYALDGRTGQELWSSGDQIASWNHFSGISVANGRVFIATYDGNVYSFGLKK